MPAFSLSTTADLINFTRPTWEKDVTDMISVGTPLLSNLMKMSKVTKDGGLNLIQPGEFFEHSQPSRLTDGYDLIDYTFQGTGLPLVAEWADVVQAMGISGNELRKNAGQAKIADMAKSREMNTKRSFERSMQTGILRGTSPAFTDIVPLDGDGNTDGTIQGLAVGSQNNTYYGLAAKTPYVSLPGMQNQYATAGGSFATAGLRGLYGLLARARAIREGGGVDLPEPKHQWYFSPACYELYKASLTSLERFASADKLDGGRIAETYQGVGINIIRGALGASGLPTNWSALLIDHAAVDFICHAQRDNVQGEWKSMEAAQMDAIVAHRGWMGQLFVKYLGTHGVLINAEA
jgi:hypothetical protein